MYVIPVINCKDLKCVEEKIAVAKKFVEPWHFFHIDVADGTFSPHRTWNDPEEWKKLAAPFNAEVHLMVEQPENIIGSWVAAGVRRFVVHVESLSPESVKEIIDLCDPNGIELMLSSGPDTPIDALEPYLPMFGSFQVLAVRPGPAGQVFLPDTLEKIRFLREEAADATIEVDGGMNPETAKLVKAAGADTIVSSNYIFGAANPKEAYEALKAI